MVGAPGALGVAMNAADGAPPRDFLQRASFARTAHTRLVEQPSDVGHDQDDVTAAFAADASCTEQQARLKSKGRDAGVAEDADR